MNFLFDFIFNVPVTHSFLNNYFFKCKFPLGDIDWLILLNFKVLLFCKLDLFYPQRKLLFFLFKHFLSIKNYFLKQPMRPTASQNSESVFRSQIMYFSQLQKGLFSLLFLFFVYVHLALSYTFTLWSKHDELFKISYLTLFFVDIFFFYFVVKPSSLQFYRCS